MSESASCPAVHHLGGTAAFPCSQRPETCVRLHVVKAHVFRSQTAPQACVSFRLPVIVSICALVFETNCQEHIYQAWPSVRGRLLHCPVGKSVLGIDGLSHDARWWHHREVLPRPLGLFFLSFFLLIAVPQKCIPPLRTLVHERLPSEEAQPREDLILALSKFYRNCSKGHKASGSSTDSLSLLWTVCCSLCCVHLCSVPSSLLNTFPLHISLSEITLQLEHPRPAKPKPSML